MSAKQPFLLRFMEPCVSPSRSTPDEQFVYDDSVDMMRWLGSPERPLVVHSIIGKGLTTKKKDVEKGDDDKDWRMWR